LRVLEDLLGWCTAHGVAGVAELIGAMEDPA
jgi:hypothetical protein